jgi:MFS family permease
VGEHKPIRQAGQQQGVQIDVWIRRKRGKRFVVERTPAKDQWYAYCAAWMGWTLDAFDFTVFLLIMAPIAQEFGVPLIDVTAIFSVTLVMRLGGATASGWLADRLVRRAPLMISILWYSICNFLAGFSPSFTFLFVIRALLGHRHGGGMAGRRGASDGILAGAVSRANVRRLAGVLGIGLRTVRPGVWLPVWTVGSMA